MDNYDNYCQVTFEDWFYRKYPKGVSLDLSEDLLPQVEKLMKEAWLSRYETLTYHDI